MIALDTNVLIYAHRTEAPKYEHAKRWLFHLAKGTVPWGLPVFCIGEFLRVVTHRNVFDPPSSLHQALRAVEAILQSPSVRLLNPSAHYFDHLKAMLESAEATGNLVFDAQIAAVCRDQGISDLVSDDRDFMRFPNIKVIGINRNPDSV